MFNTIVAIDDGSVQLCYLDKLCISALGKKMDNRSKHDIMITQNFHHEKYVHVVYIVCAWGYWYGIYLIQSSPAVKKCVAPKKAVKIDAESKVAACDSKSVAKILIMTTQVNFTAISWPVPWISHLFSQQPSWGPHTF